VTEHQIRIQLYMSKTSIREGTTGNHFKTELSLSYLIRYKIRILENTYHYQSTRPQLKRCPSQELFISQYLELLSKRRGDLVTRLFFSKCTQLLGQKKIIGRNQSEGLFGSKSLAFGLKLNQSLPILATSFQILHPTNRSLNRSKFFLAKLS
jgi:hypothetical protein